MPEFKPFTLYVPPVGAHHRRHVLLLRAGGPGRLRRLLQPPVGPRPLLRVQFQGQPSDVLRRVRPDSGAGPSGDEGLMRQTQRRHQWES